MLHSGSMKAEWRSHRESNTYQVRQRIHGTNVVKGRCQPLDFSSVMCLGFWKSAQSTQSGAKRRRLSTFFVLRKSHSHYNFEKAPDSLARDHRWSSVVSTTNYFGRIHHHEVYLCYFGPRDRRDSLCADGAHLSTSSRHAVLHHKHLLLDDASLSIRLDPRRVRSHRHHVELAHHGCHSAQCGPTMAQIDQTSGDTRTGVVQQRYD